MKIKRNSVIRCAFALIFVFILILGIWWSGATRSAFAEEAEYSNALDDLKKDEAFDRNLYPDNLNDYSLQLITVSESESGELFVYVYQPSGQHKNLRASSINISTDREAFSIRSSSDDSPEPEITFKNYPLRYINSDGVFFKYAVEGLTVSFAPQRYYGITQIMRPFIDGEDTPAADGNIVTETEFAVEEQFCFGTKDGEPHVEVIHIETIEITDKFVGYVRYSDGFKLYVGACDSHFVAFNTDRDIDKLIEADVYYTSQSYSWVSGAGIGESEEFGEKQDNIAYLTSEQHVDHTGDGWFAGTYSWDRIETVEQFLEENEGWQNVYSGAVIDVNVGNEITEEGKAALEGKQWVLRFAETSYSLSGGYGSASSFSTLVGDVMILRLKFETDGVTYNLGVIDNKQTGSRDPINDEYYEVELSETGKWILAIIALILLLLLLWPVLPYIIKAVVWVITLPFKAIKAIVNAVKKKKLKQSSASPPKVQAPQPKTVYVKSDKPKQSKEK